MFTSVGQDEKGTCSVELTRGDRRVSLTVSLGETYTGGGIATVPNFRGAVEGADEAAKTYSLSAWLGGMASGAFYAFRSLSIPRRRVWLHQLEGRLGSDDMEAVAAAAVLAVASLSEKESPPLELEGWTVRPD